MAGGKVEDPPVRSEIRDTGPRAVEVQGPGIVPAQLQRGGTVCSACDARDRLAARARRVGNQRSNITTTHD